MDCSNLIETLLTTGAHTATKYLSDKRTAKATRRLYNGKPIRRQLQFVVTVGPPNYAEREFIKKCKKAGEPLPVKKIQLKFAPS